MGERNLMKYDNKGRIILNIYVSEKELNLILEELYMYLYLADSVIRCEDRGLRIFESMLKRVELLDDIKNKQILRDLLSSIVSDIKFRPSFDDIYERIENRIDDFLCIERLRREGAIHEDA